MFNKSSKIKVTVDKSHLFTLGEKMYRESIEFVRELVNNGYDADATDVYVIISDDKIMVEDNGSGMNEKGLEQFFTIGSEEKKARNISPRFGRKRIGQFGIGKFSALSLARQFIVESVKGHYKYSVTFDREEWQSHDIWELPIKKEPASVLDREGTKIILNQLIKKISLAETEKYLKQSVPLRAKKFNVYLNNKKVTAKTVAGKIISVNVKTMYGEIAGEIILALNPRDVDEPGLECRVKQVFIKRELFDLEKKHHQGLSRVCGYINADFLPLISARSDFLVDSQEYKLFYQIVRSELDKVLKDLKKQNEIKNIQKINLELQKIMQQVRDALNLNPDIVPQGKTITRLKRAGKKKIAASAMLENEKNSELNQEENKKPEDLNEQKNKNESEKNNSENNKEKSQEEKEKNIEEAKPLVMKKIKLKKMGITCGIVSLGEDGPEVMSQGNTVYINLDHPLYQKTYVKKDMFSFYLLRLITQEIVLMKKIRISATEAFEWQSKLLKDALCQ
jgi:hypothetical protein